MAISRAPIPACQAPATATRDRRDSGASPVMTGPWASP
jgi:hypothetical protein